MFIQFWLRVNIKGSTNRPMQILSLLRRFKYSLGAKIGHPEIMWAIISINSLQNLHLGSGPSLNMFALFCKVDILQSGLSIMFQYGALHQL